MMATVDKGPPVGNDEGRSEAASSPDVPVTAHQSGPDRTVFVERDNTDAWIASSLTVSLDR
jgi:hypothetical protein